MPFHDVTASTIARRSPRPPRTSAAHDARVHHPKVGMADAVKRQFLEFRERPVRDADARLEKRVTEYCREHRLRILSARTEDRLVDGVRLRCCSLVVEVRA